MALGPGDEEGCGIGRANVVQVAGDAERFSGPLPASFCRVQPPADEYQCQYTPQSDEEYQPVSLGEGHRGRAYNGSRSMVTEKQTIAIDVLDHEASGAIIIAS